MPPRLYAALAALIALASACTISNNLAWGNEGGDMFVNPLNSVHRHDDIGAFETDVQFRGGFDDAAMP